MDAATVVFFTHEYGGTRGNPRHLNLANWRRRVWQPALRSAGLERDGQPWLPPPVRDAAHVRHPGNGCRVRLFEFG
jgi:hypothetical protein